MAQGQGNGYVGRSLPRREDRRLLVGRGQFVADLKFPDTLHAVFVRSQVAHARIRSVDLSRAAASPGVAYVLNGAELAQLLPPVPDTQLALPRKWATQVQHKFLNPQQSLLAHDKVRHVGEAVAVILAESRYLAEDAAELVALDLEPLPAIVDPEAALEPGAPVLHDKYNTNLIGEFRLAKGDVEAALARAPHRLKRRFYHHRYGAIPMECRGVVSVYDERADAITIWSSCQVVHWLRREASTVLNMPEARIRCVALDVGGGFGVKGHVYPEELLIAFLARAVKRPVRWIEDRHEHFMSACHSRDQIHDVEAGFDDDGRLLAFRDSFIADCGAWNPIGAGISYNTAVHLPGPYKFDNFAVHARIAATSKVPNAPYRGAGRPEATFAMERTMDLIAGELGLDPADVRLRNMVPHKEMPYRLGIPYRDGEAIVYDSGTIPRPCNRRWTASAAWRRSGRGRKRRAGRAAISGSASAAMSRAPASARSRAPPCASTRPARSMSPPGPARRARAWKRSSRRWSPTPGRSSRTTWSWRSPTPRRSRSDSAPSPAAARSRSPPRSITPAKFCARRPSPSPPTCSNARQAISSCAAARSASSAFPATRSRWQALPRPRARAGIMAARKACRPASRRPTTTSRRP